jgi:hypothetical protein
MPQFIYFQPGDDTDGLNETPQLSEEFEIPTERERILEESDRGGADISLELLECRDIGNLETRENEIESLKSIELHKSIEEQPEAIELLEQITPCLIAKLEKNGIRISNSLEDFINIPNPDEYRREWELSNTELTAIQSILNIANNPRSKLAKEWARNWKELIDETGPSATAAIEIVEQGANLNQNPEEPEEEQSLAKRAWNWGTKKGNRLKATAIVAAGAIGMWAIVSVVRKMSPSKFLEKGKLGKTMDILKSGLPLAGIGLSLFLVGGLLGPDKFRGWIRENLNINLSKEAILKAIKERSWDPLFEGIVEVNEAHENAAAFLGVEAEKIGLLDNVEFDKFTSVSNAWSSFLTNGAYNVADLAGIDTDIPFLHDEEARTSAAEASSKLQELFSTPAVKAFLAVKKPKTVGEALTMLNKANYFEEPSEIEPTREQALAAATATVAAETGGEEPGEEPGETPPENEETPRFDENPEESERNLFGEGEAQFGVSTESWDELEEKMGSKPKTKEWMETHSGLDWINPFEMKNFVEAVYDDGMALVQAEGMWLLWDGAEYIMLSPINAIIDTALTSIESLLSEDTTMKDAVVTYYDQAFGWVVLFGGPSILRGAIQALKGNLRVGVTEMARGVAKGTAGPVLVAWWQAERVTDLHRWGKDKWMDGKIEEAVGPKRIKLQKERLRYYSEQFTELDKTIELKTNKEGMTLREQARRKAHQALRLERLKSERQRIAGKIKALYEDLYKKKAFGNDFNGPSDLGSLSDLDKLRTARTEFDQTYKLERIQERAIEIGEERRTGRFRKIDKPGIERMLAERSLSPETPEGRAYMEGWDKAIAEQEITGERFNPHVEIEIRTTVPTAIEIEVIGEGKNATFKVNGEIVESTKISGKKYNLRIDGETIEVKVKKSGGVVTSETITATINQVQTISHPTRIQILEHKAGGPMEVSYQGSKITIPAEEAVKFSGNTAEIHNLARQFAEKKWRMSAVPELDIKVVELAPDGRPIFEVEGERILESTDRSVAAERYLDALRDEGKKITPELEARIRAASSYAPELELALGTVGVALMIWHIETAPDRQEAILESMGHLGAGLIGVIAYKKSPIGMKMTRRPYLDLFLACAAGIYAGYYGGEMGEDFITEIMGRIPGNENGEVTEIVGTYMEVHMATNWVARPLGRKISTRVAPRLLKTAGMQTFERVVIKSVQKRIVPYATRMAGTKIGQYLLPRLGWKGAVAVGLLADDATVIGVIDDILLIPLAILTAYDIVVISKMWKNAKIIEEEMKIRENKPIERIEFPEVEDKRMFVRKLTEAGIPLDQIYKEGTEEINPEALNVDEEIIKGILDNATVIFHRPGGEYEKYELQNGEAIGLWIHDAGGNEIASMTLDDIDEMEEAEEAFEEELEQNDELRAEIESSPEDATNTENAETPDDTEETTGNEERPNIGPTR